tara:strand:- start:35 stop:1111 length:1077 start_codon:yes stop_codon:yes gene_type:complete
LSFQQLTLENRPLENKPFRYITLDEQTRFYEFINEIGVFQDKKEDIKTCASEFYTYDCVNDPSHTKKVKYVNCGIRGICPRCSMSYARKRAEIMYQYIKQNIADNLNFDLKMNQIVLTLPKELHDNLDNKTFAKMIKKFMVSFGIEAYGYAIQYRHSNDPLSSKYIHAHVLTLNIKEHEDKLIQNDYYFDLEKMRDTWKSVINEFTHLDLQESDPVNIHTEYASVRNDKRKIAHLLAYVYRYPIQDLFNVQVRKGTIDYLESEQFDHDYILMQIEEIKKDPKNLAWSGLMTSTKRGYLEKLLTNTINELVIIKPIPFFIKQIDERSKKCPDCNFNYSDIPIDKGKYLGDNEPVFKKSL